MNQTPPKPTRPATLRLAEGHESRPGTSGPFAAFRRPDFPGGYVLAAFLAGLVIGGGLAGIVMVITPPPMPGPPPGQYQLTVSGNPAVYLLTPVPDVKK